MQKQREGKSKIFLVQIPIDQASKKLHLQLVVVLVEEMILKEMVR